MSQVTINEAMEIKKQLVARQQELVSLRNENSVDKRQYFGANADKHTETIAKYDVKQLDKIINKISKEIRVLGLAIKSTNQSTKVRGYDFDETIFGEIS
jgi:hypothetical protein